MFYISRHMFYNIDYVLEEYTRVIFGEIFPFERGKNCFIYLARLTQSVTDLLLSLRFHCFQYLILRSSSTVSNWRNYGICLDRISYISEMSVSFEIQNVGFIIHWRGCVMVR